MACEMAMRWARNVVDWGGGGVVGCFIGSALNRGTKDITVPID